MRKGGERQKPLVLARGGVRFPGGWPGYDLSQPSRRALWEADGVPVPLLLNPCVYFFFSLGQNSWKTDDEGNG